jgi:hypothetical protein
LEVLEGLELFFAWLYRLTELTTGIRTLVDVLDNFASGENELANEDSGEQLSRKTRHTASCFVRSIFLPTDGTLPISHDKWIRKVYSDEKPLSGAYEGDDIVRSQFSGRRFSAFPEESTKE